MRQPMMACFFMIAFFCNAVEAAETKLRACMPNYGSKPPQPFTGVLRLPWESWDTSQLVTSAAAIILAEKMGFTVEFIESPGPKVYV